ncbi:VOC family protein [Leifsonia sp. A12D58]|uniref:VOC family protein n=1 Tax=Leifsonia sp. A12D58 TaxID=3397674 RepID=UPI0039E0ED0A
MLDELEVVAVLPVQDMTRARAFYKDAFGLDATGEDETGVLFRLKSGTSFMLYETPNAGSAKNTQLCWMTPDLDRDMAELRSKGVTFADIDMPGLKTENGVATLGPSRSAWFSDSEGNVLCIGERA